MDKSAINKLRDELIHKRDIAAFAVIGAVEGALPWLTATMPGANPVRLLKSSVDEFHAAESALQTHIRTACTKAAGES